MGDLIEQIINETHEKNENILLWKQLGHMNTPYWWPTKMHDVKNYIHEWQVSNKPKETHKEIKIIWIPFLGDFLSPFKYLCGSHML